MRKKRFTVFVEGILDKFNYIFKQYLPEENQPKLFSLFRKNNSPRKKLIFKRIQTVDRGESNCALEQIRIRWLDYLPFSVCFKLQD